VLEKIVEKISKALGVDETNCVVYPYGSIADADLAGGAPIDQGNKIMIGTLWTNFIT
jgi:hypothetical protein